MYKLEPLPYVNDLESKCKGLISNIIEEKKYYGKLTIDKTARFIEDEVDIILKKAVETRLDENYKVKKVKDGYEVYIEPKYIMELYNGYTPLRKSLSFIHGAELIRRERNKCANTIETYERNFILSCTVGDGDKYVHELQHKLLVGMVKSPYTVKKVKNQSVIYIRPEYINAIANGSRELVPSNELHRCISCLYAFYDIVSKVINDDDNENCSLFEIPTFADKEYNENIIKIGRLNNYELPNNYLELVPFDDRILISIKKSSIHKILKEKGYKV